MEAEENLNYQDIYYLPRALTSMGEDFRKIITDCEGRFASFPKFSPCRRSRKRNAPLGTSTFIRFHASVTSLIKKSISFREALNKL